MIRQATPEDIPTILNFIRGLARYENLEHTVVATEEKLRETLFSDPSHAEVLLACAEDIPVGFALFFHNYSTFLAQPGLYLEDLFILPEHRSKGHGKALFLAVVQIARERHCGRLEWSALDWNTPAHDFYKNLGASMNNDWIPFRLDAAQMETLGGSD